MNQKIVFLSVRQRVKNEQKYICAKKSTTLKMKYRNFAKPSPRHRKMQLTQLVYVSSYVDEYGTRLPDFIENSALGRDNANVLGMTLFANGNIIQLLEGRRTAVKNIYHKLPSDTYQFGAMLLIQSPIENRCLAETCIGFSMHSLRLITRPPSMITLFKLDPLNVRERIKDSPGRLLMESFAAEHK